MKQAFENETYLQGNQHFLLQISFFYLGFQN